MIRNREKKLTDTGGEIDKIGGLQLEGPGKREVVWSLDFYLEKLHGK